jgi:hypothetical protein
MCWCQQHQERYRRCLLLNGQWIPQLIPTAAYPPAGQPITVHSMHSQNGGESCRQLNRQQSTLNGICGGRAEAPMREEFEPIGASERAAEGRSGRLIGRPFE